MSYSDQKKLYQGVGPTAGLTTFDREYISRRMAEAERAECPVETMMDSLRGQQSAFNFKPPLKEEYLIARDRAINCLEMGADVPPRRVHHWIDDLLKCTDCILRKYLQDVLKDRVKEIRGRKEKERDIYNAYDNRPEDEMKDVGRYHNAIYDKRNKVTHYRTVSVAGRAEVKPVPNKELREIYEFAKDYFKRSMDIMVPCYRKAYPGHCRDGGQNSSKGGRKLA